MVRRSGAKAGDRVIVTGTIGDAALGLANRTQPDTARNWNLDLPSYAQLIGRYLLPEPRLGLADALQSYASAAMDVSDGLVGDLAKLCGTSGVSAKVNVPLVPLSQAAQRAVSSDAGLMETILTGGDDYEIVCTVPPDHIPDFWAGAAAADIAVTDIGEIIAGHEEPRFVDAAGTALSFAQKSFSHF
jgi:thiamine-monophosphate kinase